MTDLMDGDAKLRTEKENERFFLGWDKLHVTPDPYVPGHFEYLSNFIMNPVISGRCLWVW